MSPEVSWHELTDEQRGWMGRLLGWCLHNKLAVALVVLIIIGWGVMVAPFAWDLGPLPRDPVPADAIPDIGENQQIVFTRWPGRSPRDIDDQITYPLTTALAGVPGVRTVRSYSMFGFSSIYLIFEEDIEYYWSRSRVLEKLNSLPPDTLPDGVRPSLGPDATALGQVFWYTLEGRDPNGNPVGGWDLEELRTIQDWQVRLALLSARGVAEVASVGGFQREYQVDVDPDAMRAYGVTLPQIERAVAAGNLDVGAKTIEVNGVEYFIRGIGFIEDVEDIAESVVAVRDHVPILVRHVASVSLGPALRRGALDKDGAEAVGGVVVARYGYNPLEAIDNTKQRIDRLAGSLPTKVVIDRDKVSRSAVRGYAERHGFEAYDGAEPNHAAWVPVLRRIGQENWPEWVTTSQVTVIPFYDRTGLIYETLGTLSKALEAQMLVTLIVVILMLLHLRSSALIGGMLPMAVLLCFIAMKTFGVDANVVALSGIAIAIGTIVDMGIVVSENILRHLDAAPPEVPRLQVIHRAVSQVGGAVLTAVATTVVSFLPVFAMTGAEGKLFRPLAFTKTFALLASIVIALMILPPAAHVVFCGRVSGRKLRHALFGLVAASGAALAVWGAGAASALLIASGVAVVLFGAYKIAEGHLPPRTKRVGSWLAGATVVLLVGLLLTRQWEPLGVERGLMRNLIFVALLIGVLLLMFKAFQYVYAPLLRWCLRAKAVVLVVAACVVLLGAMAWLGFETVLVGVPVAAEQVGLDQKKIRRTRFWTEGARAFPGLGKEFMPPLDEGSFLYMPTTMTHASIGEAMDVLSKQDMAFQAIPEIQSAVGKIGRAETPLDPAPVSMVETVINYWPEFMVDRDGRRLRFRYDPSDKELFKTPDGSVIPAPDGEPYYVQGRFLRDARGRLIPDDDGMPFRLWRPALDPELNPGREPWDGIHSPDDIWQTIVDAGKIPGTTSAPKLQPIAARLVMLQSGMRAPMGVKIQGPDLETIEDFAIQVESLLKEVPTVKASAVIADRIVGKPYREIVPDPAALSRYGLEMRDFQNIVVAGIGGRTVTTTVEGRERFAVRVRYKRELRDTIEAMKKILVPGDDGSQVPIGELADIRYVRGPQVIKSEDTFLTGYVLFDMNPGNAEVDVIEDAQAYLEKAESEGTLVRPGGVKYEFAGTYENQQRAQQRLTVVLPLALILIFLILYFQFHSVPTTLLVFSGIFLAWAGGFLLLWLYGTSWFLDFSVFGVNMRELFQVQTVNLSVAVWVGFLALFGIATDDGVIQATYLTQVFRDRKPASAAEMRDATITAARRRVRPCLMTSATTILALIPVLTSTGRGSDVMVPMAIPSFGGMLLVLLTLLVVPTLYCWIAEFRLRHKASEPSATSE